MNSMWTMGWKFARNQNIIDFEEESPLGNSKTLHQGKTIWMICYIKKIGMRQTSVLFWDSILWRTNFRLLATRKDAQHVLRTFHYTVILKNRLSSSEDIGEIKDTWFHFYSQLKKWKMWSEISDSYSLFKLYKWVNFQDGHCLTRVQFVNNDV